MFDSFKGIEQHKFVGVDQGGPIVSGLTKVGPGALALSGLVLRWGLRVERCSGGEGTGAQRRAWGYPTRVSTRAVLGVEAIRAVLGAEVAEVLGAGC